MKRILIAVALLSTVISTAVVGQSSPELPAKLSGRWTATTPTGIFVDSFSLSSRVAALPGQ